MNAEARSQVHQALLSRCHTIADHWYQAIARTNHVLHSAAKVRQRLIELTEQAIALLFTEPFERGQAQAIGASLASLRYIEPQVLSQTQEVLAQQLIEGLSADQVVALQPRLAELFGGLVAGYFDQAREAILSEQEQTRSALTATLRQAKEAVQRAYDEVEQQVQERTAELRAANESLRHEIAERKQAEDALRMSARQWHATFDAISDAVCLLDLEGGIQRCNEAMAELLGKPFSEIVGHTCWELVHSSSGPIEGCPVAHMRESRRRATLVLLRGDQWFDVSADPVLDEDGSLIGAVHIMTDITERKQAEEALRESEERYRSLFEGVPVGLYRITPDGHFLDVNQAMLKMLDYPDKEPLLAVTSAGLQLNVIPDEEHQRRRTLLDRNGAIRDLEAQLRQRDGTVIWARSNLRAACDADGQVLYYEGSVEDITERKLAKDALRKAHDELETRVRERTAELAQADEALRAEITERKRAEESLQDREATARALLNAPIEAATLVDANGIILAANETVAERFEKSVEELAGLCVYDLWSPAVAKFRKAQVDKVFRLGAPMRFEDQHEGRFFDHSFYPVFDARGRVARIAVFVRDITHRKQAEERIRTYQAQLRSLASQLSLTEERERRRIAMALHDRVGQTLAISKMKLGALRQSVSSTELAEPLDELHEFIEEIIRDTRSLTFELSSPILYQLGLEAALEWLTEQTQHRHGILSYFEDDGQPKPLDDDVRVLLFQAVRELLVNVAKHAQAQSVKVAMRRDGGDVRIIVEDDGVGFDAFPIGSHGSEIQGFGLFSIRERLDHLGGQLKIVSTPGHGTQVTLVAPLKRAETP